MDAPRQTPSEDLARSTFRWFARAARARHLYSENNAALERMLSELEEAMNALLEASLRVTLLVRPDAFLIDGEPVLEEPDPEDSIPFVFFRDGVRRLELLRGLSAEELRGLLWATAAGLRAPRGEEDVASRLWQLDLEHLNYIAVDSTMITDAGAGEGAGQAELDGVLRALYGSLNVQQDARISVHLDEQDAPAQQIAQALQSRDELSPGLFPTLDLEQGITGEADWDPGSIRALGVAAVVQLMERAGEAERARLAQGLIKMLDAALQEEDFSAARRVVLGVRQASLPPHGVDAWLDAAIDATRLRHTLAAYDRPELNPKLQREVLEFLRVCTNWAVDQLLPLLPELQEPARRHEIAALAVELGIYQIQPLKDMLQQSDPALLAEVFFMLSKLDREDVRSIVQSVVGADRPELRLALAKAGPTLHPDIALKILSQLLRDEAPEVRAAAARSLGKRSESGAAKVLEDAARGEQLQGQPFEVRRAVFESFAERAEQLAEPQLMRRVREGERLLTNRETDENAAAAAWGLSRVRSVSAVEILKRACNSRHKRLREAATEALEHMRRHT